MLKQGNSSKTDLINNCVMSFSCWVISNRTQVFPNTFNTVGPIASQSYPTNSCIPTMWVIQKNKRSLFFAILNRSIYYQEVQFIWDGKGIQWNSIVQEQSGKSMEVIKQENICYAILRWLKNSQVHLKNKPKRVHRVQTLNYQMPKHHHKGVACSQD